MYISLQITNKNHLHAHRHDEGPNFHQNVVRSLREIVLKTYADIIKKSLKFFPLQDHTYQHTHI